MKSFIAILDIANKKKVHYCIFIFIMIFILIIQINILYAETDPKQVYTDLILSGDLQGSPFILGEELVYSISYMGVIGGELVLRIEEIIYHDDALCYKITATIKSNRTFSLFFKVDNYVESIYDVLGGFSRRYYIRQREGNYRNERTIELDYENMKADYTIESQDEIQVKYLERYLQDSLSIFYEIRKKGFENKNIYEIPIISGNSEYDLKVELLGRRQLRTSIGNYNTFHIKPYLHKEGEFKDKGDLEMYITNDHRRVPVLITVDVVFGNVRAELRSARIPQIQ